MKKPDWKLWLKDKRECKFWLDNYSRKKILKKSPDDSRLHLRKTDHNLTFANWIIDKHKNEIPEIFGEDTFYDWVISIYYYGIYHAFGFNKQGRIYLKKSFCNPMLFNLLSLSFTKQIGERRC